MTVIVLFNTCFGLRVSIAWPWLRAAVPSRVVLVFFRCFTKNANLTTPVGMPPPGATGWISAFSPIDTTFPWRNTAWGTRTTWVVDRATDSEADPDTDATKWASPL